MVDSPMFDTEWDERRDFETRLIDGHGISVDAARRLIADADAGERVAAVLEGLKRALRQQLGIVVVDVSTDDEDEVVLELVNGEEVSSESAIGENLR